MLLQWVTMNVNIKFVNRSIAQLLQPFKWRQFPFRKLGGVPRVLGSREFCWVDLPFLPKREKVYITSINYPELADKKQKKSLHRMNNIKHQGTYIPSCVSPVLASKLAPPPASLTYFWQLVEHLFPSQPEDQKRDN